MAGFRPRLPTWHNTVQTYRKTGDVWASNGSILGQVYTPLRNQDDEEGGLIYFEYPIQSATALRDGFDGIADAVGITFPGGAVKGYRVREVLPRWLGFPNQHMIASLQRLRSDQWALISGDLSPADCSVVEEWPDVLEIDTDSAFPGAFSVTRVGETCVWQGGDLGWSCGEATEVRFLMTVGAGNRLRIEMYNVTGSLEELMAVWIGDEIVPPDTPPLSASMAVEPPCEMSNTIFVNPL